MYIGPIESRHLLPSDLISLKWMNNCIRGGARHQRQAQQDVAVAVFWVEGAFYDGVIAVASRVALLELRPEQRDCHQTIQKPKSKGIQSPGAIETVALWTPPRPTRKALVLAFGASFLTQTHHPYNRNEHPPG